MVWSRGHEDAVLDPELIDVDLQASMPGIAIGAFVVGVQIAELLVRRFEMGIRFTGLVPEVCGTASANHRFEELEVVSMDEDVGVGVPGNPASVIDGADQRASPGQGLEP